MRDSHTPSDRITTAPSPLARGLAGHHDIQQLAENNVGTHENNEEKERSGSSESFSSTVAEPGSPRLPGQGGVEGDADPQQPPNGTSHDAQEAHPQQLIQDGTSRRIDLENIGRQFEVQGNTVDMVERDA